MSETLTIPGSRKKALLILLLSIAFVALGLWLLDENPPLAWASILFFGLGIPVSLLMLRPGATCLRLDAQGFDMVAMFRVHRLRWSDVQGFELAKLFGNKMIVIHYAPGYRAQAAGRAVASALSGAEGAIPDHYALPIEDVAALLSQWHARHAGH